MHKYKVLQAVTFRAGRFKLSPEQFDRRRHIVNVLDSDSVIVEPRGEICFKRGETVETDIDVTKAMLAHLCPLTPENPANDNEPRPSPTVESTAPAAGAKDESPDDGTANAGESGPSSQQSASADDPLADVDIGGSAPPPDASSDTSASAGGGEPAGSESADSTPPADHKTAKRSRVK